MRTATTLFSMFLTLFTATIMAQDIQSGVIEYEEVVKFEIKLEGEMAAMMADFPKENKSNKILYFSKEASLFEAAKSTDEDASEFNSEGGGMRIMMSAPENKVYIDLEKKEILEQREFMTRMFLIQSDLPDMGWKITGAQKMILDFPCMEAQKTDTAGIVTKVWFAPSLPISAGPDRFCNLPGMVLGVDIDNGKHTLVATSVKTGEEYADKISKPKEGKKVSQEKFDEIQAEKLKEMGVEGGGHGGANVVIRIHQ